MRISDCSSDVCSSDLIDDLRVAFLGHRRRQVADALGALHGDVDDARPVQAEDDAALQGGGGVVEVNDDPARALDRLEGAVDQVVARLGQHRMVTSSGILFCSISSRTKSKSVCEAEGKPTSISLKPISTSSSNMRRLRAPFIGSTRA